MNKIEQVRTKKGMSKYRLAKLSGLDYVTITKIEKGGDVKLSNLRKIAKALGVNPLYLFEHERCELELTDDEIALIIEYRASDVTTRQMIQRILSYKGETS